MCLDPPKGIRKPKEPIEMPRTGGTAEPENIDAILRTVPSPPKATIKSILLLDLAKVAVYNLSM